MIHPSCTTPCAPTRRSSPCGSAPRTTAPRGACAVLRHGLLGLAVLLVPLAAAPAPALAQSTGAIEGTVVDTGGGALPGVTVTLAGPLAPPGAVRVTGLDGRFAFEDVPAGGYVVTSCCRASRRGRPRPRFPRAARRHSK